MKFSLRNFINGLMKVVLLLAFSVPVIGRNQSLTNSKSPPTKIKSNGYRLKLKDSAKRLMS